MKRSRLRRTRFRRRTRRQNEEGRRIYQEYLDTHDRCAVCHWPKGRPGRKLERHHIQGRRKNGLYDPRNLVLVCDPDHAGFHFGGPRTLTLGQVLTAKFEEDGAVDLVYLAWLRGKSPTALELAPLPQWAMDERRLNGSQFSSKGRMVQ